MKVIKGTPENINEDVIGRITKKTLRRFKRKDAILATNDTKINHAGYQGLIIDKHCPEPLLRKLKGTPLSYNIVEFDYLNDGDVVLIDKDGQINVLYKKDSPDNAILITEECNSNCIMCPQPKKYEKESKTPFNIKLITLMDKHTTHLGITGGEPTLIGEELYGIISACKRYIPEAQIDILTNGIKFNNFEYTRGMVLLMHPNLVFAVPLYADTDNEHNFIVQSKSFYKTIQGIYNLALFNQKIEIRVVVQKANYERLPALAEFIYHNFPFTYHVAFMGMETIGLAHKNIEKIWIDPHGYTKQLEDAVLYLDQRNMNVSIYNLQLCVLPEVLRPFSVKSISLWKNIYLDECEKCDLKNECGGLFSSSRDKHSMFIKPLNRKQT